MTLRNLLGAFLLPFVVETGMVVARLFGLSVMYIPPVVVGFTFLTRLFGPGSAGLALIYVTAGQAVSARRDADAIRAAGRVSGPQDERNRRVALPWR